MKGNTYLDDPIRMYACQGNEPNPASSPPTIRRWAVCFANDTPQPENRIKINYSKRIDGAMQRANLHANSETFQHT